MTKQELANLRIARQWLDLPSVRNAALGLIDDLIAAAEKEHAKKEAQHEQG